MRGDKISVVVPCYKQALLLPRAFDSLAAQNYQALEVIVVDDGSPEPVAIPPGDWPFEVKLIRQNNKGLSGARNTGLKHVTGRLVKFLDADDELLEGCLKTQARHLDPDGSTVSVIGFVVKDAEYGLTKSIIPAFGDSIEALSLTNIGPPHCFLYPSHLVKTENCFCTEDRVAGGYEDYDMLLRLAYNGVEFLSVHALGVVYHQQRGSMSTIKDKMETALIAVWSYQTERLLKGGKELTTGQLSSLLTGLDGILSQTKTASLAPIQPVVGLLADRVRREGNMMSSTEVLYLKRRLERYKEAQTIMFSLDAIECLENRKTFDVHLQEIIDRRIRLQNMNSTIDEEWIVELLECARRNNGRFAIYGAGVIGEKIYKILRAGGFAPTCFFDKNASSLKSIDGIEVFDIVDIGKIAPKAILIASVFYYDEIRNFLRTKHPAIEAT